MYDQVSQQNVHGQGTAQQEAARGEVNSTIMHRLSHDDLVKIILFLEYT
jgi:hypothetical protein